MARKAGKSAKIGPDRTKSQKLKAIHLIVGGETYAEVASRVGICRTTLYQWRLDPWFQAELETAQAAVLEEAANKLRGLLSLSVAAMVRCLDSKDDAIVLKAATAIIRASGLDRLPVPEVVDEEAVLEEMARIRADRRDAKQAVVMADAWSTEDAGEAEAKAEIRRELHVVAG